MFLTKGAPLSVEILNGSILVTDNRRSAVLERGRHTYAVRTDGTPQSRAIATVTVRCWAASSQLNFTWSDCAAVVAKALGGSNG